MSLQFELVHVNGRAAELQPYSQELLSQVVDESRHLKPVEALERWFLKELARERLQPVEGDRPKIRQAFSAWETRGGTGQVVSINVVALREPEPESQQDVRVLEGQLVEALEHGQCLWLVYDNEVNMLERLRGACARGKFGLHFWNLADGWMPAFSGPNVRPFDDPFAHGIEQALRYSTSDRTVLVLQDIMTNSDALETNATAVLLTQLVSDLAQRKNMRLVVLRPEAEIPPRWRGLFQLIRVSTSQTGTPVLDALADDLTARAKVGKLEPLIGRRKELEQVLDILNRAPGLPNSPLLVGKAGVGKTAIIEGLAIRIATGKDVPRRFQNRRVMSLSATALGAGSRSRSELEARLQALMHELETHAQSLIVFVDEIHTLMDVGGDGSPAAQALKAGLGRGYISLIGATTDHEAVRVENDPAFARRFSRVIVQEPDVDQTVAIALKWRKRLEEHHHLQVEISEELVKKAVEEADWHIIDQNRPYSALSLLGQAASLAERRGFIELKEEHLTDALELTVGMKLNRPGEAEHKQLDELEAHLRDKILGQDEAISKVMRHIRGRRLIRTRRSQPFSMLLVGPSGVGKTELAVQIGQKLFPDVEPIIYHMETYKSSHQVTDLLGAPPSFVGYDKGSKLVNDIRTRPRTVLIIDEVEKATPEVAMAFMGILDRGEYRDPRGVAGDFRHAYFLITTNAVRSSEQLALNDREFDECVTTAFGDFGFGPEQVARFGPKVKFQYLSKPVRLQIAEKQLKQFAREFQDDYQIAFDYSDTDVLEWLADMAADPRTGARQITNLVTELRGRLAEVLDFRQLPRRMKVVCDSFGLDVRVIE